MMYKPKLKRNKYYFRPRSILQRNAFSPYLEAEVMTIRRTNYVLSDPRRMSRLGWLSQQQSDENELRRLLESIGVVF